MTAISGVIHCSHGASKFIVGVADFLQQVVAMLRAVVCMFQDRSGVDHLLTLESRAALRRCATSLIGRSRHGSVLLREHGIRSRQLFGSLRRFGVRWLASVAVEVRDLGFVVSHARTSLPSSSHQWPSLHSPRCQAPQPSDGSSVGIANVPRFTH